LKEVLANQNLIQELWKNNRHLFPEIIYHNQLMKQSEILKEKNEVPEVMLQWMPND